MVVHFEQFFQQQAVGFEQTLAKARRQLCELSARIERGRGRNTADEIEAEIAASLKPGGLNWGPWSPSTGPSHHRYASADASALLPSRHLPSALFGKRVPFTDGFVWPIADVVTDYSSQSHVEVHFRKTKDRRVISSSPKHHWVEPQSMPKSSSPNLSLRG